MKKEYAEVLQRTAKKAYAKALPVLKKTLSIIASVDWKKYIAMAAGVVATVGRALWGHWQKASWKRKTGYVVVLFICGYVYIGSQNETAEDAKWQAERAAREVQEIQCLKEPACVAEKDKIKQAKKDDELKRIRDRDEVEKARSTTEKAGTKGAEKSQGAGVKAKHYSIDGIYLLENIECNDGCDIKLLKKYRPSPWAFANYQLYVTPLKELETEQVTVFGKRWNRLWNFTPGKRQEKVWSTTVEKVRNSDGAECFILKQATGPSAGFEIFQAGEVRACFDVQAGSMILEQSETTYISVKELSKAARMMGTTAQNLCDRRYLPSPYPDYCVQDEMKTNGKETFGPGGRTKWTLRRE